MYSEALVPVETVVGFWSENLAYVRTIQPSPHCVSRRPLLFSWQERWIRDVEAAREKVAAEAAEPIPTPKGNKKVP